MSCHGWTDPHHRTGLSCPRFVIVHVCTCNTTPFTAVATPYTAICNFSSRRSQLPWSPVASRRCAHPSTEHHRFQQTISPVPAKIPPLLILTVVDAASRILGSSNPVAGSSNLLRRIQHRRGSVQQKKLLLAAMDATSRIFDSSKNSSWFQQNYFAHSGTAAVELVAKTSSLLLARRVAGSNGARCQFQHDDLALLHGASPGSNPPVMVVAPPLAGFSMR